MSEPTPQVRVVNALVESFRARDLNKFASLIHQDFIWNDGDGGLIGGKQTLLDGVSAMWRDHPNLVNEVSECIQIGELVTKMIDHKAF
jgi:hypothetical protein